MESSKETKVAEMLIDSSLQTEKAESQVRSMKEVLGLTLSEKRVG